MLIVVASQVSSMLVSIVSLPILDSSVFITIVKYSCLAVFIVTTPSLYYANQSLYLCVNDLLKMESVD